MVCDRLLEATGITENFQTKFHSLYLKKGPCILLKPQTFMNVSGLAVQEAAKFYNIAPKDLIVVHDDIELPFGTVRKQTGGGMGGHNGLRSVKQSLGTEAFGRLRLGVGRPPAAMQVSDFVLGRFTPLEEKQFESALDSAVKALLEYM